MMPAMSVSWNSTSRVARNESAIRVSHLGQRKFRPGDLAPLVRQQSHEAGSFDGLGNGMLTSRLATCLATTNNFTMPIGQLAEQVEIFVIHKHGPWTDAIDAHGILLGNLRVVIALGHIQIQTGFRGKSKPDRGHVLEVHLAMRKGPYQQASILASLRRDTRHPQGYEQVDFVLLTAARPMDTCRWQLAASRKTDGNGSSFTAQRSTRFRAMPHGQTGPLL